MQAPESTRATNSPTRLASRFAHRSSRVAVRYSLPSIMSSCAPLGKPRISACSSGAHLTAGFARDHSGTAHAVLRLEAPGLCRARAAAGGILCCRCAVNPGMFHPGGACGTLGLLWQRSRLSAPTCCRRGTPEPTPRSEGLLYNCAHFRGRRGQQRLVGRGRGDAPDDPDRDGRRYQRPADLIRGPCGIEADRSLTIQHPSRRAR